MDFILTIVIFILVISSLVLVHEFGHFIAAKIFKIPVQEFAIGFGKSIYSRNYKGTIYKINILPLGGYVNLEGETDSHKFGGFRNKPFLVKFVVLTAGVFMNLLFASLLLNIFLILNNWQFNSIPKLINYNFNNVEKQIEALPLRIIDIQEGSNSDGILESSELIVSLNGYYYSSFSEFKNLLLQNIGKEISIGLINLDKFDIYTKRILLDKEKIINDGVLGVKFSSSNTLVDNKIFILKYPANFLSGFNLTVDIFIFQIKALWSIFSNAFQTGEFTEATEAIGGLPAITNQVGQIVTFKVFEVLIPFTAFISISLAFINILPIPALDGGQLLIYSIETLIRKKIPDKVINYVNLAGFAFLLFLGLLVNIKDIIKLDLLKSLFNFINSFFGR